MDMAIAFAMLRNTEILDRVQNPQNYDRMGRRITTGTFIKIER